MPPEKTPALQKIFSLLAASLMRHKGLVRLLFLLLLILAACQFYSLHLDSSLSSLFPDSSPQLSSIGRLLDFNPGARALFVELTAKHPGRAQELPALAEKLRLGMANQLHTDDSASKPEAQALLNLLPLLFDADLERELREQTESAAVRRSLGELRTALHGPLAFMPTEYWRQDPLGLLQELKLRLNFEQPMPFATKNGISVAPDGQRVLLLLQPQTGLDNVYGAEQFMAGLEAALAALLPKDGSITAKTLGGLRFSADNTRAIERDLKLTLSLALLFIALIYFFTVRSPAALWLLLTPAAAVLFSGSLLSWLWPSTAGLALGFGAAVLGLAEDYAVLAHFALRKNTDRQPEAIGRLARPMLFSAGLCAGAFCILMLSGIPALRQLGFFAAFSLLCGLGIALFVLPSLPYFAWPRLQTEQHPPTGTCLDLHPKLLPTLLLTTACLGVCFFGFSQIKFDASFSNLGVNSAALQRDLLDLRAHWQAGDEPQVWASSGHTLDEVLLAAAGLSKALRAENTKVFSLADLLPPQETRQANLTRWNAFVAKNAPRLRQELEAGGQAEGFRADAFTGFADWFAAARPLAGVEDSAALDLLRRAGLGDLLWWMLLEKDDTFHILTFSGKSPLSQAFVESLLQERPFDAAMSGNASGSVSSTRSDTMPGSTSGAISDKEQLRHSVLLSSAAMSQGLNKALEREKHLLPLAGIVCLGLLVLCFRRPRLVLLASLPPLFGLASVIGWLSLSGTSLNLVGAAALILVIGLGADYGIVMLHELASDFGLGAFKSILVSGLTTLAGLGVLILAEHPALQTLGSITFFGLSAEMLAVLLLVPYLCRKQNHVDSKTI